MIRQQRLNNDRRAAIMAAMDEHPEGVYLADLFAHLGRPMAWEHNLEVLQLTGEITVRGGKVRRWSADDKEARDWSEDVRHVVLESTKAIRLRAKQVSDLAESIAVVVMSHGSGYASWHEMTANVCLRSHVGWSAGQYDMEERAIWDDAVKIARAADTTARRCLSSRVRRLAMDEDALGTGGG